MKKHQIILIHGGDSYETYDEYLQALRNDPIDESALGREEKDGWKDVLGKELGADYDVIFPEMPNWMNAQYEEWKIWFEKLSTFFNDEVLLLGHSLGGIFLARYLGENIFSKKIKAVFLLAAPYRVKGDRNQIGGGFITPADLTKITDQSDNVFVYASKDDPIVDFAGNYDKYIAAMPKARGVVFEDKNHFILKDFPEIAEAIRNLYK